jgi:hypothetical protein
MKMRAQKMGINMWTIMYNIVPLAVDLSVVIVSESSDPFSEQGPAQNVAAHLFHAKPTNDYTRAHYFQFAFYFFVLLGLGLG